MIKQKNKKSSKNSVSYISSWNFIKESRKYIYTILILFILSAIFGYFYPIFFVDEIAKLILSLATLFDGLGTTEIIMMIMGNNIQAGLMTLLFGFFFGIVPLFGAIFNGYLVGFILSAVIPEFGFKVLWMLVPHGIFELPAIFISMGLGLKIGVELFNKKKDTRRNFVESLRVFVLVIVPLLVIAGIIEGLLMTLKG